ncbi:AraC family transcriptional regulator [Halalkalibacter sp. AB-rgal2]|uniref:AraC family transcriptional regulator n=1 Tax=Halalkalibacter sp. AB-rgal2 TaxID=3242695 RepID=UPI00359F0970
MQKLSFFTSISSYYSISDISMLLQFSDQSYFTSSFKKFTGLTPSQYHKKPQN